MRMSLIFATSPSTTLKLRLTRLRSAGVTVVTTWAAYMLRLMYCRLSSCSARSASALSYGRPSARPTSRSALRRTSASNSLMPEKLTSATVGRSSTMTISTSPLICRRTSVNRPRANSERMAVEPLSSLNWSPMRNGSEANTVPGSTRCKPSTRMSRSWKGSTAQAGNADRMDAAMTLRERPRRPPRCFFMRREKVQPAKRATSLNRATAMSAIRIATPPRCRRSIQTSGTGRPLTPSQR